MHENEKNCIYCSEQAIENEPHFLLDVTYTVST